ncbi:MAG: ornithine carbamoyltransferase, partial [Brachybacterium sp.]|nr:ornithine carbamoyltransferase [Brachybacterium sp.]
ASQPPDPVGLARAEDIAAATGGSITGTEDPREAVAGATAVITDTWVSMGQEGEDGRGEETFSPYQVTDELMELSGGVFLHCLPAYRGKEVAASVIDGPTSVVWDEAENRLHAQKALLAWLLTHPDERTAEHAVPLEGRR